MKPKISVIIPVRNIEKELTSLIVDCLETAGDIASDCEVVVVDDDSSDATHDIAETLSLEYPQIRLFSQRGECGTGNAVAKGLQQAKGNFIYLYYMSSGHVFPQISLYYDAMSFCDAVLGYFVNDAERYLGMAMFKHQALQVLGNHITHPEEMVSRMKKNHIRYLELRYEMPDGQRHEDASPIKKPTFRTRLSRPATFIS